jgi:hypothetical protein
MWKLLYLSIVDLRQEKPRIKDNGLSAKPEKEFFSKRGLF